MSYRTPVQSLLCACARRQPRPLTARREMTRSKSVASNNSSGELLVGSEAKMRSLKRVVVETRDAATQTICDMGTQTRGSEDAEIAAIAENAEMAELDQVEASFEGQSQWLDRNIQIQGELEMALRSGMELLAERMHHSSMLPPMPPFPQPPQPPAGTRRPGARHPGALHTADTSTEHLSDGECHREDDEVRSLSLSEDGPVIRRSHSEGSRRAPDVIAMFSDGQHRLPDRAADVIRRTVSEPLSDHSAPNESDQSGARTEYAADVKKVPASNSTDVVVGLPSRQLSPLG